MTTIEIAQKVVDSRTYSAEHGLDLYSASAIVGVANVLRPDQRERLGAMAPAAAAAVCFRLLERLRTKENR